MAMHICSRIGSVDAEGNNILDFEKRLTGDRTKMVENLLGDILKELSENNSVADLVKDLKQRPHLNDIPIKVKEFLGLPV